MEAKGKKKSNENMKISSVLQGKETSERKKEIEKKESEKKSGQAQKNMKRVVGRIEDSMSSTQKEQIAKFRLTIIRSELSYNHILIYIKISMI